MSSIITVPASQGYVSTGDEARSSSRIERGELVSMSGAFYRKNDPDQPWKMPGRSLFGSAGSTAVKGLAICQFDQVSSDKLIAAVGTTWVSAAPGDSGTFSSLVTGLTDESTRLTSCHQNDRWYLGNGYDTNRVLSPDGTVRLMGMQPPTAAPTYVIGYGSTTVSVERPSNNVGSWVFGENASDGQEDTFASAYAIPNVRDPSLPPGAVAPIAFDYLPSYTHTWYNWSASAVGDRKLRIRWGIFIPTANSLTRLLIEKSENGGSSWTTMLLTEPTASTASAWLESPLTSDSSLVQIRVTFGAERFPCYARIHEVQIVVTETATTVTSTDGVYYATTEYFGGDLLESPPLDADYWAGPIDLVAATSVTITKPSTTNTNATHWQVYRIADGAEPTPQNLGNVSGLIPIAQTTWKDTFTIPIDEPGSPIISLVEIGDLAFYRDSAPPPFISMISWRGSICGITKEPSRTWYYSDPGLPESFPAPYYVASFPLDEHDTLVGQMLIGETFVLLCRGAMLALDDIPRVTDGVFNNVDARPLRGHPGCVGNYAYTAFSVVGESRGAWVSPFGVYVTNGTVCECISTDLSWVSEVNVAYLSNAVLKWDADNLILWLQFDFDGDGLNDREMPFHMGEIHQKGGGKPKLGQPTEKATACMASALISSDYYRFSGHPSNGGVYLEGVGTQDAATGEEVEIVLRSGRVSLRKTNLGVIKATLEHTDFGSGETGTLTITTYRDAADYSTSRAQDISLSGDRGTTVGVGRAGEHVDFEFRYNGSAVGGIGGVDFEIGGQGRSGSAPRQSSSSVTP